MATLEDRLLGEKQQYYCSSSEDEDNDDFNNEGKGKNNLSDESQPWGGTSTNTGPKGVLQDWQRYKQLKAEERKEQELEKIALAKKLTLTCSSHLDDEKAKEKLEEEDVDKLIDQEILQQFIQKRMEEMMVSNTIEKKFGKLYSLLNADEFLDAVDKESKAVTVIIHLYEDNTPGCIAMNGCLTCLAGEYPEIKFCCLKASSAGTSRKFQGTGLPALLIYKGGNLVGNFVRLIDEFGDDFFATDVESFLVEHGFLHDKSLLPSGIKSMKI